MTCSNCQTENKPGYRFCANCGTSLEIPEEPDEGIRGARPKAVVTRTAQGKNPMLPAVISFFIPGVGQFINGDNKKGALMLGGAILLAATVLGYLILGVYAAYDAHQVAEGKKPIWN